MGFGRIPGAYADVIITSERCSFAFGFPETKPAMSKGNKSTTYCEMRTKRFEGYDRHFYGVETLTLTSILPNWKVGIRFEGSANSPYSVRFREPLSPTDIHEALLK